MLRLGGNGKLRVRESSFDRLKVFPTAESTTTRVTPLKKRSRQGPIPLKSRQFFPGKLSSKFLQQICMEPKAQVSSEIETKLDAARIRMHRFSTEQSQGSNDRYSRVFDIHNARHASQRIAGSLV